MGKVKRYYIIVAGQRIVVEAGSRLNAMSAFHLMGHIVTHPEVKVLKKVKPQT